MSEWVVVATPSQHIYTNVDTQLWSIDQPEWHDCLPWAVLQRQPLGQVTENQGRDPWAPSPPQARLPAWLNCSIDCSWTWSPPSRRNLHVVWPSPHIDSRVESFLPFEVLSTLARSTTVLPPEMFKAPFLFKDPFQPHSLTPPRPPLQIFRARSPLPHPLLPSVGSSTLLVSSWSFALHLCQIFDSRVTTHHSMTL